MSIYRTNQVSQYSIPSSLFILLDRVIGLPDAKAGIPQGHGSHYLDRVFKKSLESHIARSEPINELVRKTIGYIPYIFWNNV